MRAIIMAFIAATTLPLAPVPVLAQSGCAATETMRGGRNNYRPNAPVVENLGTGWTLTGVVREAGSCTPLPGVRIQVWAATDRGGERTPSNHGSVLTDADGRYTMPFSEIRPQGGQLHVHIAHDDPGHEPVFLRWVLARGDTEGMTVDINLAPSGPAES